MKLILVVEDDEGNGEMLSQVLAEETLYRVVLISDCQKALKFTQHIKPRLFILDYLLPQMTGIELYDHLHAREKLKDVPAIIISVAMNRIEQELQERSLIGIAKPFEMDELINTIETLLKDRDTLSLS